MRLGSGCDSHWLLLHVSIPLGSPHLMMSTRYRQLQWIKQWAAAVSGVIHLTCSFRLEANSRGEKSEAESYLQTAIGDVGAGGQHQGAQARQ